MQYQATTSLNVALTSSYATKSFHSHRYPEKECMQRFHVGGFELRLRMKLLHAHCDADHLHAASSFCGPE
jgi:hypothetical protein